MHIIRVFNMLPGEAKLLSPAVMLTVTSGGTPVLGHLLSLKVAWFTPLGSGKMPF